MVEDWAKRSLNLLLKGHDWDITFFFLISRFELIQFKEVVYFFGRAAFLLDILWNDKHILLGRAPKRTKTSVSFLFYLQKRFIWNSLYGLLINVFKVELGNLVSRCLVFSLQRFKILHLCDEHPEQIGLFLLNLCNAHSFHKNRAGLALNYSSWLSFRKLLTYVITLIRIRFYGDFYIRVFIHILVEILIVRRIVDLELFWIIFRLNSAAFILQLFVIIFLLRQLWILCEWELILFFKIFRIGRSNADGFWRIWRCNFIFWWIRRDRQKNAEILDQLFILDEVVYFWG